MNVVVDVPQPVEGAKMQDSIFYYDTSGCKLPFPALLLPASAVFADDRLQLP